MNLIYIVQDCIGKFRGAFSTLELARECYISVAAEILSSDDFQLVAEHLNDGDWDSQLVVYELDGNYIWSYNSLEDIDAAVTAGESYDD